MELRQLRYFLAVAEELHFGRAAQRLRMSQPPLSVQIRGLERELGTELLHRSTRQVELTAEGEAFARRVRRLLDDLDGAVAEVRDIRDGLRGRLRVGFVSSASIGVVPGAVRGFRERHPGIELELSPLTSGEQFDALRAGRLDLGLVRESAGSSGLRLDALADEAMVAVLPADHPLAAKPMISPADLAREPLVLFPQALMPGFHSQVRELFRAAGETPGVVQEAIHHETVLGLVAAGVGLSVLPDGVSRLRSDDVVTRPIESAARTTLFVALPAGPAAPGVPEFLRCLRDTLSGTRGADG